MPGGGAGSQAAESYANGGGGGGGAGGGAGSGASEELVKGVSEKVANFFPCAFLSHIFFTPVATPFVFAIQLFLGCISRVGC
jgi:selenocysteine lyase/cysteine desulfurase